MDLELDPRCLFVTLCSVQQLFRDVAAVRGDLLQDFLVEYADEGFGPGEQQACRTVQVSRCAYRYQAKRTLTNQLPRRCNNWLITSHAGAVTG